MRGELTITELFARLAARTPSRLAAVSGEDSLTYGELNARSLRVARWLVGQGAGSLVAVRLERSLDMLVGLLAVLRSGAAYLPLTSAFPPHRVEAILADARPNFLLESLGEAEEGELPEPGMEDLAYVMYTSGSTGTPKGVCIPHGAVADFCECMSREPGLGSDDVVAAVTPITFDMSVTELWLPLTVGASTVLATGDQARDGRELLALLRRSGVTVLQATPATFRLLLEAGWAPGDTPALRAWLGGEHFGSSLATAVLERAQEVWNCYGPTEATVYCSVNRLLPGEPVLLGPPLPFAFFELQGEELLVGGRCLARGYVGKPFAPGALFRTGDRVRPVGDRYELLGRTDDQIKLRGYRIEPGDVEAALASHPAVRACAVGARGERLSAWVVARRVSASALREFLAERLPGYMVPSVYHFVSALPLNLNGKVDRGALPSTEDRVAEVFRELLGASEGDFFALGGDSLLAAQAAALLGMRFQVELPAGVVFDRPTVPQLVALLESAPEARDVAPAGELTFAQERWLFLERLGQGQVVRRAWRVRGVDAARLSRALEALLDRHEALRTVFQEGRPVVLDSGPVAGPVDISWGPVFSVALAPERLELAVHHIAADRQSMRILVEELGLLYAGLPVEPPGAPVAAFAAWERARLTAARLEELQAYWRSRLGSRRVVVDGRESLRGRAEVPAFPGVTDFVVVMAAFQVLLAKWTGETDLTVGFPVSLRERAEFVRTVGCLVNVLPLRGDLSGDPTFGDLLEQIARRTREAIAHQDLPFEKLVECMAPARDGRHPLFTVMLAMDGGGPDELRLEGAEVTPLMVPPQSHPELTLTVEGDLFSVEGAPEGLFDTWPELLRALHPDVRVSALPGRRGHAGSAPPRAERPGFPPPGGRQPSSGPIEESVKAIFERHLGLASVGPEDSFFALGGHSLLALRVVTELEKALARSIPLSVLFEAQTPRALAAALEDAGRLGACFVSLSEGVGPPLYCVHPNRGTVQIYRGLADRLACPVRGFELVRRRDGRLLHDSVAAMAAHYVEELLRQHPKGPHNLCGVSLGGRIAYEMALLLRARGVPEGRTVMLDTWGPGYPRALPLADLRRLPARERLSYATKRLRNLRDRVEEGWMRTVSRTGASFPRDWEDLGARPFLKSTPVRPFPGRLHLFRAEEQPFGCVREQTLGWGPYVKDLVITEVPGYHERMLSVPHVNTVARQLAEVLE